VSPVSSDGKSLTAANVAISLARDLSHTAALVDYDLHRPSVADLFGVSVSCGVDDFLVYDAKFTYRFLPGWQASVGVDNITDELYHVSHPYPMRTYLAELKYTF
jgi:Mrp family chromosome partitioning ATPase